MAVRVRDIDFDPYGGVPGQAWDADPAWDAMARSSRRVSERYAQVARDAGGVLRVGCLRLGRADLDMAAPASGEVHVAMGDPGEGIIHGSVTLPEQAVQLDDQARALWSLTILHEATLFAARAAGVLEEPFATARHACLAEGLDPRWEGPWKSSPSHRLRARLVQRIDADGWARMTLEVVDRNGLVAAGQELVSPGTLAAFRRDCKDLRWDGDTALILPSPDFSGRLPADRRVTVDELLPPATPRGTAAPVPVVAEEPVVHVEHLDEVFARMPARVELGGIGADAPGAPPALHQAWHATHSQVTGLAQWWSHSPYTLLEIGLHITDHARTRVTAVGPRLWVDVARTPAQVADTPADELVRAALREGLDCAARRAHLAPAPTLPNL